MLPPTFQFIQYAIWQVATWAERAAQAFLSISSQPNDQFDSSSQDHVLEGSGVMESAVVQSSPPPDDFIATSYTSQPTLMERRNHPQGGVNKESQGGVEGGDKALPVPAAGARLGSGESQGIQTAGDSEEAINPDHRGVAGVSPLVAAGGIGASGDHPSSQLSKNELALVLEWDRCRVGGTESSPLDAISSEYSGAACDVHPSGPGSLG